MLERQLFPEAHAQHSEPAVLTWAKPSPAAAA